MVQKQKRIGLKGKVKYNFNQNFHLKLKDKNLQGDNKLKNSMDFFRKILSPNKSNQEESIFGGLEVNESNSVEESIEYSDNEKKIENDTNIIKPQDENLVQVYVTL